VPKPKTKRSIVPEWGGNCLKALQHEGNGSKWVSQLESGWSRSTIGICGLGLLVLCPRNAPGGS
jgi:hypothetical protein